MNAEQKEQLEKLKIAKDKVFEEAKPRAEELSIREKVPVYTMVLSKDFETFVVAYFKKPSMAVLRLAGSENAKYSDAYYEFLFQNCIIKDASDNAISDDEDLYFTAISKIGELLPDVYAEVKKN